ncbi:MAG: hypothetical protein WC451_04905 [Patescibacteria group bacterium]
MAYTWEVHGDIDTLDGFTTKVRDATIWIQDNGRQTPGTVVRTSDNASDYLNFSVCFSSRQKRQLRDLLIFSRGKTYKINVNSAIRDKRNQSGPLA